QMSAPFFPSHDVAGLVAVAADPTQLWAGLGDSTLLHLDPFNLRVVGRTYVQGRALAIAIGPKAVWSVQFADRALRRIDALTGRVSVTTTLEGTPTTVAVGDGSVWVGTSGDDRLWRLSDRTGQILA